MDIRFWNPATFRDMMSTTGQAVYGPSRRWILLPILVATGLAVTALAAWFYGYGMSAPTEASPPWSGWWFPFGWFFIIPVFFLVFFAFRWFFWGGWWWGRGSRYGWGYDPALEILRERFARGEVTKEQYEQMKEDLVGRKESN